MRQQSSALLLLLRWKMVPEQRKMAIDADSIDMYKNMNVADLPYDAVNVGCREQARATQSCVARPTSSSRQLAHCAHRSSLLAPARGRHM